jgi:peptide deformylase
MSTVLPIVAYGDPVLKKKAAPVEGPSAELTKLIGDMFETMYNANGVGLAAPQVGKSIRLFVVDGASFAEDDEPDTHYMRTFKKVFINPQIIDEKGAEWGFNEGCLSIPGIREEVFRNESLKIRFMDEKFKEHTEEFYGYAARIIQHEYDHLEGKLFVEKINPLRRQLLKRRLDEISKGIVDVTYKMIFPKKK